MRVTPDALAAIVAVVDAATWIVAIANDAVTAPGATVTVAGTLAALLLSLSVTANPPAGAADVSVTVPCAPFPPVTLAGFTETAESAAGPAGADCGVKLRTLDHAPAVPAELRARTRHQCCRTTSEPTESCDDVTV